MAVHEKSKPEAHQEPKHKAASPLSFARAGNRIINLAHVIDVTLPVEGDAKQPLSLCLANGGILTLAGEDADAFLVALGDHCDCGPCKPAKPTE
jgi:hypothetical protein